MNFTDPAVKWLLDSGDPSIRYLTLTDVLGEPPHSADVAAAQKKIPDGPLFKKLLTGQRADGGFGVHPYQKWTGAHWRLVSLVELGIPPGYRPAVKASNQVLNWLTGNGHIRGIKKVNGLTRRCASQEGNALAVCSRLGLAEDPRVVQLADSLVEWQWPDGGWNCDRRVEADHSSFNESLSTLWGLVEYQHATGDVGYLKPIKKASELFLEHKLFRSDKTGEVINPEWSRLHYPLYWHYDILQALTILARAGKLDDPRTKEALDIVQGKRGTDGLWNAESYYWHSAGGKHELGEYWSASKKTWKKRIISSVEVVDWGHKGPSRMITLNSLRVLKLAGRVN